MEFTSRYRDIVNRVRPDLPKVMDDKYVEERTSNGGSGKGGYTLEYSWSLCGQSAYEYDMSGLSKNQFVCLAFDTNTKFSKEQEEKFDPESLIEVGKKFGLGLDRLHKAGIDGTGVNVALVDWTFDYSNPEFTGDDGSSRIMLYDDSAIDQKIKNNDGFHGKTVTSLLAGKDTGVAPKSNIYHFASNEMWEDRERVQILEKIIDMNKRGQEISVVSMSASFSNPLTNKIYTEKLAKKGCDFISSDNFWKHFSYYNRNNYRNVNDENNFEAQNNATSMGKKLRISENIHIPCGGRSYPQIGNGYMYCGYSSASWTIPQAAGLLALAKQMDPNVSYEEFSQIAKNTCHTNSQGYAVVNPEGIVRQININNQEKSNKGVKEYEEIYSNSSYLISNLDRVIEDEKGFKESLKSGVIDSKGSQETRENGHTSKKEEIIK